MTDWNKVDRAVLDYIDKQPCLTPANSRELSNLALLHSPNAIYGWRVIDRRTQFLRKKGLIELSKKGRAMDGRRYWVLTNAGEAALREGENETRSI